ncbi:hypothetical protein SR1949_27120 [Sphaerospermopsis reniformis]|jgi:hypothetical protein|uniref:Uncharacterized protein n=1 Tax=Sphaerospermopsis reniformis TaxID=531300 RepID=A0A480A2R4_9CYAN|nr:hypothetical protein SR1949_27120 [Sphaerospermopsis reniformis]
MYGISRNAGMGIKGVFSVLFYLVGAKHRTEYELVSAIGYRPNASPLRLMNRYSSEMLTI